MHFRFYTIRYLCLSLERVQKSIFGGFEGSCVLLSTSLLHCSWVTLCHFWHFNGFWPPSLLSITFQRFSMKFRCGNCAGHDWVLNTWSSIHTLIDLAVRHGALSCWKSPTPKWLFKLHLIQEYCNEHRSVFFSWVNKIWFRWSSDQYLIK